jgi:molecular chaperone DnaK
MAKEADAHAAEDKEQRELIEARNGLDSLAYNIEKMLKEAGDKVQGSERSDVEAALAEARKTLEGTPSTAELKASQEKLTAASHKMAEVLYKANAAQASSPAAGDPNAGPTTEAKKDEGVIDAEYVDVEEKK